jgi:hypothetical protein
MRLKAWRFPARTLEEIAKRAAAEGINEAVLVRRAIDRELGRLAALDQFESLETRVERLENHLRRIR